MAKTHNVVAQTLLVSSTAVGLSSWGYTAAHIAGVANGGTAVITADQPIRILTTGTPTATFGHIIAADEPYVIDRNVDALQIIRESASDANVTIELDFFEEV